MARNSTNSTRSVPLAFSVLAALSVLFLGASFAAQRFLPPIDRDLIRWVEIREAVALAGKSKKPLLYDFSADWCGPCKLLRKEIFNDKSYAQMINQYFVPVQVIDRSREDGSNPLEIERLQKKYQVEGFPTLVVVKAEDSEIKKLTGYNGKEKTREFLSKALTSSLLGKNNYAVDWAGLDDQLRESSASKKPLLILCWNENGELSRYRYLMNRDLVSTINANFLPVELAFPIKADATESDKAKALLKRLAIKKAPALVIVPADGGIPHFQVGSSEADDNLYFLRNYLRLSQATK